jgi:anti-anti-sigma factor
VELSMRRTVIGTTHVLSVVGDIDLSTIPRFTDALTRLLADATGSVVMVDLDGAHSVDDAALGLLLGAAGRARSTRGDLEVVATEPRLRARLTETGFERAVSVRNSVA